MGYTSGWGSRSEMEAHLTKPFRTSASFFKAGHPQHGKEHRGSLTSGNVENNPLQGIGASWASFDDVESKDIGSVVTIAKFWSGLNLWTVQEVVYDDWYLIAEARPRKVERTITCYMVNRFKPNKRDSYVEWGYKPVGESMGPCYQTCPLKFLDMVEDPGGFATEWREGVRAYWASRKMTRKAVVGDVYAMVGLRSIKTIEITSIAPKMRGRADNGISYSISRVLLARKGTFLHHGPTERENTRKAADKQQTFAFN